MASTFQQTDTAQVCALSNYCSSVGGTIEAGRQASVGGTAGTTEATFTVAASQADDNEFSFELIVPAGYTWSAGNWTVNVNFTTGNADATWESCFICRVNSSCVNQASIGSATGLGIATKSGAQSTVISGAAQTPGAGDKVIITLGFSNASTMFARTVGITPSTTVLSPFSAPVNYSITAETGSVSETGVDATLLKKSVVAANVGAYALTGLDVTLTKAANKTITADVGVYSFTGVDTSLYLNRVVAANEGSYVLTGVDAALTKATHRTITADVGAYDLTGVDATLTYAVAAQTFVLTADVGDFAITAQDATLTYVPVQPQEEVVVQRGGSSKRRKRPKPRYWWEEEEEQETVLGEEDIAELPTVKTPPIEMPRVRFMAEPEAPQVNLAPIFKSMRRRGRMKLAAMIAMRMLDE